MGEEGQILNPESTRRSARPLVIASHLALLACGSSSDDGSPPGRVPTSPPTGPAWVAAYSPPEAVWYRDVSAAVLYPESPAVIAYLDRVGWGLGRMQIDFST